MADLISWGSLFQTEAAATTKARSPIVERRVDGMASEDDLAERRCLRNLKRRDRQTDGWTPDRYIMITARRSE